MVLSDFKYAMTYQNLNYPKHNKQLKSDIKPTEALAPSQPQPPKNSEQDSQVKIDEQQVEKIKKAMGDISGYVGIARVMIDGKYTAWGKVTGADKTVSEKDIARANEIFIRYGVDFASQKGFELLESTELSVDEFMGQYESHMLSRRDNLFMDTRIRLADGVPSDYGNLQIKSSSFKPIQAVSKNTETYNIYTDQKFAYLKELLKNEQERGIDVLWLMQKLEENGEKIINKKV